jgi:predicted ATP-grasp superfamily ATP-dependent carboligase
MQEYIQGVGVGFSALYDQKHCCVMSFQHKRLREYPVEGGPSTYCQSIFQKNIDETGKKLLDFLQWTGPAMVEFKYDDSKERLVLLEINPRYWGSLPLARHSNLNFPLAHFKLITTGEVQSPASYAQGEKVKFIFTDLLALLGEMSKERRYFSIAWSYLKEFFDSKLSWGLWMLKDPWPSVRYLLNRL